MEFADKSFFLPKPGGNKKDYENFDESLSKLRKSLKSQLKRIEKLEKEEESEN